MKITRKIKIDSPAKDVWKTIADEFVSVHLWMAGISNSVEITTGKRVENAPLIGRKAEVAINPGSFLKEIITRFDQKNKAFTVNTTLVNSKKGTPLKGYKTEIKIQSLGDNVSEVIWSSKAFVKPIGYLLFFPIKKGLSSGFYRGLEELKCFVETGVPHERKLADPHCS